MASSQRLRAPGNAGHGNDAGLATSTPLYNPTTVAVDGQGNLFIAEGDGYQLRYSARIRKVSPDGLITTVAGNGEYGSARMASQQLASAWLLTAVEGK